MNPTAGSPSGRRLAGRGMRAAYRGFLVPLYGLVWLTARLTPGRRSVLDRRLGLAPLPRPGRRPVWFHAASVGEVSTVGPVVAEVMRARPELPVVVTTMTATGARRAAEKIEGAEVVLAPYDFQPAMRRLVSALEPACLIIGETEIWPNLIGEARRFGASIALVNGRISERSFPRYRLIRALVGDVLEDFDLLMMRSPIDAHRILELGADPGRVEVAGNTKYDILPAPMAPGERSRTRRALGLADSAAVVTLGSAREGETEVLLRALCDPRLRGKVAAIVAPRHMDQVAQIEQACRSAGFTSATITDLSLDRQDANRAEVLILARMGLLIPAYGICQVAVVGGTFRPFGGHNPLEPASQGCVTVVGPHIQNIRDDIDYLTGRSCAFVVDEGTLAGRLAEILGDEAARRQAGEAAVQAVADKKGIAAACVRTIIKRGLLPER